MTLLTAGITPDVIREMMPPYHLSADLLEGAVTILPPPPPDASACWRHARLSRLVREISVLMPVDAAQAKLAAQIVVRETADDTLGRANVPGLTVEQVCRVRRAAADLTRTSATLERALLRRQEQPAAFFGTVLSDQVDIAALDAVWCKDAGVNLPGAGPEQQPAAPEPATPEPATGIAPVGLEPAALVPAGLVPVPLDPTRLRPGSESAPEATPVSEPTIPTVAGLPGASDASMRGNRLEAAVA
jgi:hypothetical protein